MRLKVVGVVGCALAWLGGFPMSDRQVAHALASQRVANLCDLAAERAARDIGVPVRVLMAIARVEAGRTVDGGFSPWPWTVNQAGSGTFFDTAAEAMDHVAAAMAQGQRNIDIGCFQVNVHWHGAEFRSLDEMFDPEQNALYAAGFLKQLHGEFGSWEGAVGAYHSRHSTAATAYLGKVANMMAGPQTTPPVRAAERDNRYPLLRRGQPGSHGSLVSTSYGDAALPLLR